MYILTYNVKGLPWCKDYAEEICVFLSRIPADIICLQEVFTDRLRNFYKLFLESIGYTVIIPNDSDVVLLPSGLITAFKKHKFELVQKFFCPYLSSSNFEWFALKGFMTLYVKCIESAKYFYLVNTHTQSDSFSTLFGIQSLVRQNQINQLIRFFENMKKKTVVIVGDLNCESTPVIGLRYLHPAGSMPLKKRTFIQTGEDLDHIACLCDRPEPMLHNARIYSEKWSDHSAVLFNLTLPFTQKIKGPCEK